MSLAVPSPSEALLANVNDTGRLAYVIDCLLALVLGIPADATPLVVGSGNVANAVAAASLPAVAGETNYITGFEITGSGATAGLPVDVTVVGLIGGVTLHYNYTFAVGVLLPNQPLLIEFPNPIPASAVNTAITVSCPAGGAGNTRNAVVVHGFVR